MKERNMLKTIFNFITNYYYMLLIPLLSISVLFVTQYLTRGLGYFLNENGKVRLGFLSFIAVLQYLVSILITWSVLSAFNSEFLSEYETLKMTAMIIIGSSPFNITILIWVALKLEAYKIMSTRYGDEFSQNTMMQEIEQTKEKEKENDSKKLEIKEDILRPPEQSEDMTEKK